MENLETIDDNLNEVTNDYAGFWKRFAAAVIDGVLITFFTASIKWTIIDALGGNFGNVSNSNNILWFLSLTIIRWCYFAGLESSPFQASIGKLAVGIYVTDLKGKRVSFAKATGRYFGKIISGLILFIGYIIAGTTSKKQALHDTMSECLVYSK